MSHFILIGCGKKKAAKPRAARDLYIGQLFSARCRFAEQSGSNWWIVSARHGLLEPSRIIRPYDLTVDKLSPVDAAAWQLGTVAQFLSELPDDVSLPNVSVELHAGESYSKPLIACLELVGIKVTWPVQGLGIGEQLHWYSQRARGAA